MNLPARRTRSPPYETRVLLLALGGGAPALLAVLVLLFGADHSAKVRWTLATLSVGAWLGVGLALHARVVRSLHVISGLLAALREEDFSMRGRAPGPLDRDDAMSGVMHEINGLADILREQRLGAFEAGALLRAVMAEIDVAVLAFDAAGALRLANRAAERLLEGDAGLLGRDAASLGLSACLGGDAPRTISDLLPGGGGPWELRRTQFRLRGLPHTLIVLTDLRRALREEERQAWQRLVRVLGHEINNSLAPIQSIAATLRQQVERPPAERAPDLDEDLVGGLDIIVRRSEGLARFLAAYARLARLPRPRLADVPVAAWVGRVVALERRVPVGVHPGPEVVVRADGDQLDQLLINLVRNAADAALASGAGAGATVGWSVSGGALEVVVIDDGPGLADTANLFVPFFTTKPEGSGIGLVLSRQIAEAHGGTLTLAERDDGHHGCEARVRFPPAAPTVSAASS